VGGAAAPGRLEGDADTAAKEHRYGVVVVPDPPASRRCSPASPPLAEALARGSGALAEAHAEVVELDEAGDEAVDADGHEGGDGDEGGVRAP